MNADGERNREEGMARAEAGAPQDWKERAMQAVVDVARRGVEFTTDEVWAALGDEHPPESRAMGPIMRNSARDGVIVKTDRVRETNRPEANCRPVAIWTPAF